MGPTSVHGKICSPWQQASGRGRNPQAASLAGSIPHGQHPSRAAHPSGAAHASRAANPSRAASLAGSASLAAEPSSPARLCSCRSDGKPQPPKHLHSRLAPQQAFTNKLKRRKRSLQLFRCWRDGRCWQGVLLQASKHVPALALEGNGIWIYG